MKYELMGFEWVRCHSISTASSLPILTSSRTPHGPRQPYGLHRLRLLISGLLFVLVISGCANDAVPTNATLRITPESHATTVTEQRDSNERCLFQVSNYVDIPVLLQLTTADGSPIGDVDIDVYADFAANTYSGYPVLSLYDDLNGNGVVDAPAELVSGPDDDIARVKTGTWTGARALLLRVNLSCAFRGEVFAFTGGVSGRASIEVIADNTSTAASNALFDDGSSNTQEGNKP